MIERSVLLSEASTGGGIRLEWRGVGQARFLKVVEKKRSAASYRKPPA